MTSTAIIDSLLIFGPIAGMLLFSIVSLLLRSKKVGFISSSALLSALLLSSIYLYLNGTNLVVENFINIYPFSLFFIALFSSTMFLVNLLSYRYSRNYPALLFMLSFTMMGISVVAAANSLIDIFLGLDLVVIMTALMILLSGKRHIESAIKFFLLGSISIAVFSFALALIFPYDATLMLNGLIPSRALGSISLILLAAFMFIAALGFDTALFPFNLWVPDVYEGAPGNITALLAGINKKVAFVALLEVSFVFFASYASHLSLLFVILSVGTMFFGNLLALVQKDVKRMLAYSSISQAGYILIGFAAASKFGAQSSIFYIVAHSFMIIGAFSVILWLEGQNIKSLDDYNGLSGRNLFASVSLTILMLSMAGIPPLIGFDGKLLLFSSALQSNLIVLAVLGVLNSFISVYYYAKVINQIFQRESQKRVRIDRYVALVVLICLIVVILLGIYPQPLIGAASHVASQTFNALP